MNQTNTDVPRTPQYHHLSGKQRFYFYCKYILDTLFAFVATVVFLIPMLLIALLIKLDDRGPVFFRQTRIGRNQNTFSMLKFRTMRVDTPSEVPTHLLDSPQTYITRIGGFLRKTSLDELPQLLNILAGQMSIVGPRPALWNQYDLIAQRELYGVHQVLPGLTGWAQVNGRDELEIPVKAAFDGDYLSHFGLWMDIRCFFLTISALFTAKGLVEGGTGTLRKSKQE